MIRRSIFVAAFVACMFTAGNSGTMPQASAAVIGPVTSAAPIAAAETANPKVTEVRRRKRFRRRGGGGVAAGLAFGLLLGHALRSDPDYYYYKRSPRRAYGERCSYWSDLCADNWGYDNSDYYGCLRYHGC